MINSLEICKIFENNGLKTVATTRSISNSLKEIVAQNPDKLITDTYEVVTKHMGVKEQTQPALAPLVVGQVCPTYFASQTSELPSR